MRVYEVEFIQESPLLISQPSGESKILRHSTKYIEGYTIRGSILTYINKELKQDIKEEIIKPTLVFHPAYPKIKEKITRPAHPLLAQCKLCKGDDKIFPVINRIEELEDFNIDKLNVIKCKKEHINSIEPIRGIPLAKIDEKYYEPEFKYQSFDSVGINKYIRSSEIGMLYSYLALLPIHKEDALKQNTFISKIIDTEDKLDKLLKEEEFELFMGRGKSRGFGKFIVHIKLLNNYIEERSKTIESTLRKTNNILVLIALSPSFNLEINDDKLVSNLKLNIDAEPYYIYKDKNYILTETKIVSGFSLKIAHGGIPRPRIISAGPGTLFFYKVTLDKVKELAIKELTGFGPLSYAGLNILEVLSDV
ncbi:MAG: hypothetical protein ACP5IZ_09385 [Thermoprotei archaeon]